jgi:DNA-binding SARP family transcriptional activator
LFCYLLLHRDRPHARETLAGTLWGNSPTAQAKKYLRQALWQLQAALDLPPAAPERFLQVEVEWVQFHPVADLWLDVALFEQAYTRLHGVPGEQLDAGAAAAAQEAVALYQGDLLEGQYQDWCLYERERLQQMYLALLDKLIGHCVARQDYAAAQDYGGRVLRYDRAHERTHRHLMRLHYLAGDRAAALRQYERCRHALAEELGVAPAHSTTEIYEQIRADRLDRPAPPNVPATPPTGDPLPRLLARLQQMQTGLAELQQQVRQEIHLIEQALHK